MTDAVAKLVEKVFTQVWPGSPEHRIRLAVGEALLGMSTADSAQLLAGILAKLDQLLHEEGERTLADIRYWCECGHDNPSMADYCDNEVRVDHQGLRELCRGIETFRQITREVFTGR